MPYSDDSLRPWILQSLYKPGSVVDVGAGAGSARAFYGPWWPGARWTAIEAHEPYAGRFLLRYRYDEVMIADVREVGELPQADLYLFHDVLEHMPACCATEVWDKARQVAKRLVITLPVEPWPQGEFEGNPFEAHQKDWDAESVLAWFGGIYEHRVAGKVGAFLAKGAR